MSARKSPETAVGENLLWLLFVAWLFPLAVPHTEDWSDAPIWQPALEVALLIVISALIARYCWRLLRSDPRRATRQTWVSLLVVGVLFTSVSSVPLVAGGFRPAFLVWAGVGVFLLALAVRDLQAVRQRSVPERVAD